MVQFFKNIIFFIAILALVNFLFLQVGTTVYTGEYDEYSTEFRSYLFADSHGLSLGEAPEMYGVYNFSASSDSYLDIKRKIKFLIKRTDIDTIYITADDHTLSKYRERLNNLDRSSFYASPDDFDNYWDFVKEKHIVPRVSFLQPKLGGILLNLIKSEILNTLNGSKRDNKVEWNDQPEARQLAKAEERYTSQFGDKTKSVIVENALLEIIEICRNSGIVLVGIRFPLTREYEQLVGGQTFGAHNILMDKGVSVLDYRSLYLDQPALFYDQDHLNTDGGFHFSRKLFRKNN
jgi:hypothetical protein